MIRNAADAAPRPVTGPRTARLARQLEAARDAATRTALTEAFWDEAARTGTPLVETLDDAPAIAPSPSSGAATARPARSC
ncbi:MULTISPECIES: hypothetical protein [unclassified Streptomyces]|uniref:hypothetical protein n=1 Tax=unclassified Streptomyces TaxID=2593676 RepID=UPI001EF50C0B|nr:MULTISPECIES: hypothetical protein [unclassified Streptomyces]